MMNDQPSNIETVSEGWDLQKTRAMHERFMQLDDSRKSLLVQNWKIPHSLLNVAAKLWPEEYARGDFDGIDWNAIHKTNNAGYWSNGYGASSPWAKRTRPIEQGGSIWE